MTTEQRTRPSSKAAFLKLIDYAGLFPPAKLDMEPSLREYVAARAGEHAWMLGRFIVPESRIEELRPHVKDGEGPIALSVIVDAGTDARAWFGRASAAFERIGALREHRDVSVQCLEIPLPPLASARDTYEAMIGQVAAMRQRAGVGDTPAYVEIPRDARYLEQLANALHAIRRYGLAGKVRCGGVVPEAYPTVQELAAFIVTAHEAQIAFKATAGLHHPVRHYNEGARATMHGFLNLMAGALFATEGTGAVAEILAIEDVSAFTFGDDGFRVGNRRASTGEIETMRNFGFIAYGSCSFDEPIEDLTALHMISQSE